MASKTGLVHFSHGCRHSFFPEDVFTCLGRDECEYFASYCFLILECRDTNFSCGPVLVCFSPHVLQCYHRLCFRDRSSQGRDYSNFLINLESNQRKLREGSLWGRQQVHTSGLSSVPSLLCSPVCL